MIGVVISVGVILAFVFLFSEQTVDAPSLSGRQPAQRAGPPPTKTPAGDSR